MWYPTRDELIDAGVITRISLGGETTTAFTIVSSKKEFLLAVRAFPVWSALEKRFPDSTIRAVDRGWKVKEQGGNDNQIMAAIRSVPSELIPEILRESNTQTLEEFARFAVDQMQAARAVSFKACQELMNGQLDITAVLSKELVDRERRWMLDALDSQPNRNRQYSQGAIDKALAAAMARIPSTYHDVIANPASYQSRPDLLCDSSILTFEAVLSLPPHQRGAALEGMFKRGA